MKIATNILSNWINLIVIILARFFLTPFLIDKLGAELYGIWILIISIIGYMELINLGLNTSIERYTAKYLELNDHNNINAIFNTSFFLFIILSFCVITTTILLASFLPQFFNLQGKYLYLKLVFTLAGINLGFEFIFYVFSATLRAQQRFLSLNIISTSTFLVRTFAIVLLLLAGYKLLAIVLVQILANISRGLLTLLYATRKTRFLKLSLSSLSRDHFATLFSFTFHNLIVNLATKLNTTSSPIIVGYFLSPTAVTFYAIANNLLGYLQNFIRRMQEVLLPRFSQLEARKDTQGLQSNVFTFTRWTLTITIPIIAVLVIHGDSFIRLWIGPEYSATSGRILAILALGRLFHLSTQTSISALKGISKLKTLSILKISESFLIVMLSVILVDKYSLIGIAYANSISMLFFGLIVVPIHTCMVLRVSILYYYSKIIFTNIVPAFILFFLLYYINGTIDSFFTFGLLISLAYIVFAVLSFLFSLNVSERALFYSMLKVNR